MSPAWYFRSFCAMSRHWMHGSPSWARGVSHQHYLASQVSGSAGTLSAIPCCVMSFMYCPAVSCCILHYQDLPCRLVCRVLSFWDLCQQYAVPCPVSCSAVKLSDALCPFALFGDPREKSLFRLKCKVFACCQRRPRPRTFRQWPCALLCSFARFTTCGDSMVG